MRRAALARWLNLSVIAAIIAVLTVVLVSAPTRVAFALDVCGQDGAAPTVDPNMTIDWEDGEATSGPPGTSTGIEVSWTSPPSEIELIVVWRPDEPYASAYLEWYSVETPVNPEPIGFDVPEYVVPGAYSVGACWSGDGGTTWNAVDPDEYLQFTVTEFDICQPDWEAQLDPFPTTFVSPDLGYAGDFFEVGAIGGEFAVEQAIWVQVIWDWQGPTSTDPATGQIIYQGPHTPGNDVAIADLQVPDDAVPGIHDVTICYLYEDAGYAVWWYTMLSPDPPPDGPQGVPFYTVLEPLPPISTCGSTPADSDLDLTYSDEELAHSGPAGTDDHAVIFNDFSLGDGVTYYLVWDFGTDPHILTWENSVYIENSLSLFFTVPWDAALGLHTIGVCYLYFPLEGDPYWLSGANTITFNVTQYYVCGNEDVGTNDPDVIVTLTPNSGVAGSGFSLSVDGSGQDNEINNFRDAYMIQVIWDYAPPPEAEFPPTGLILGQFYKPDSDSDTMTVPGLLVPTAAQPGIYPVNVCFYFALDLASAGFGPAESSEGFWIAATPDDFQVVLAGPTATPVPPTATSVPPTATQQPDDGEDPEPEPTLTPTPTVPIVPIEGPPITPTVPIVPIQGPPVTPTVSGGITFFAPELTQTALAGLPGTPGPGTTNAGGGGGGGGGGGAGGSGSGGGGTGGGGPLNPNTGAQETTTPGAGTPGPTTTPAATATPGSTTPTPTPTQTAPSSDVQGSRTEWVASVKSFSDVTDDFDVLLTNALLTGLFLILIFLTSEIFNQTIRDNQDDIESWFRSFFGPVIGFWGGLSALMGAATLGSQKLKDLVWLGIVLVITVLIEGFLDPGFGLNKASLLLFLSLLVAVGFVTYLTEGGEAYIARTFFGQSTAVRVFPAAIGIALICVVMSRLGGFIPGILYGFVGTAVFLRPSTLNADQDGKVIFVPMMYMLAFSVAAWLLVDQFRGPNASDLDIFVEGVLIGVLIATIEGVAINMLPIAYMDGRKLIDWNPLVWIATAGAAIFLVWTILLNDERAYFNSLQQTTSQVAIFALLFCFGLSVVTWLWFRYRPGGHA